MAIEGEGKEPSAQRLIRLIDEARRDGVKVVFVQRGFPRKSAQVIADAAGGSVVIADPYARAHGCSRSGSRSTVESARWWPVAVASSAPMKPTHSVRCSV